MKTLRRYRTSIGAFMTALVAIWQICSPMNLSAATYTWNQTGAGPFTWNTGGNWTTGVPGNTVGDVIDLTANLTAAQTINLDINATTGTLNIGDPTTAFFGYTLQTINSSTLTFDNGASAAVLSKAAAATASDLISVNIILASTGNANFNITNAVANTTSLLTLSGNISESGGAHNLIVAGVGGSSNGVTVLSGSNSFTGTVSLSSGTLRAIGAQALNSSASNSILLSGGTLDLRADGNGTDSGANTVSGTSINTEKIIFGDNLTVSGNTTINVDRVGGYLAATGAVAGALFQTASNKTIQLNSLDIAGQTLTVNNNANGYSLEINGPINLSGAAIFSVGTASASTNVPGLVLAGVIDDGAGSFGFTKGGAGTLLLTNAGNSFTGNVTIGTAAGTAGGVLGVTNDGALGDLTNDVNIGFGVSTVANTFQAFDTFTLSSARQLILNSATNTNNIIAVAQGKTLTLGTVDQLGGAAANGFQKNDSGTLVIGAANASKTGAVIINGGVIRLQSGTGLGSGIITVSGTLGAGSTLQLDGGITVANTVNLNNIGLQSSGGLFSLSGSNTVTSSVTINTNGNTIGAANGATLNLNNAGAVTGAFTLNVAGEGAVNFNGTIANNLTTSRSTNIAGPAVTLGAANALAAGSTITMNGGSLTIGNASGVGSLAATGTGAVVANAGSRITIDNTGGNVNHRLANGGSRAVTLQASTLEYLGNGATASSETTTETLTVGAGQSTIRVTGGTVGNAATLTFGGLAAGIVNTGGFLKITGIDANNSLIFTAAPTLVNGVIQRAAYVNGANANLVTAGAATAVTAATLTAATGDLNNTVGATGPGGTFIATNNAQLSAGTHYVAGPVTTINALVMDSGSATTLTGTAGTALALTSGNVLIAGNTAAIIGNTSVPSNSIVIAQGTVPGAFMVNSGSSLELAATITSGTNTGLQKALDGSMDITGKQFFTTGTSFFDINGGTVKLSAGNHTLAAQQVNISLAPGATLDLNGTVLETATLASSNNSAIAGSGGTILNTSGTQATLVTRTGGNFGGQISGNIFVGATGTRTLSNNNTYTGGTMIAGGTTTLTDMGRISGTSGIAINGGGLTLTNTGSMDVADRINDAATITMSTGTINYNGRAQTASTETLGPVVLAQGASQITVTAGGIGINSADLILTSLTRSNTDAALNMNTMTGDIGSTARLMVTGGLTLTNKIVGGWAVTGGADFVSYNSTYGIGNLNSTGMAGYDRSLAGTQTFSNLAATENIKNTGTFASILADEVSGNIRVNSLVLNPGATSSLAFADGNDTLFLTSGGMIRNSAFATAIGSAVDNGRIAAGAVGATGVQTLHFHNTAAGTTTLNSRIVDNNGAAATRLVFDLYNGAIVSIANGNNSYTGGTAINGWTGNNGNSNSGTVTAAAVNAITAGGLTINNALVTATVVGGINAANDVILNMGAGLTLANGTNTLNSLTLNASGFSGSGNGGPTVTIGNATSVLNLTNATITASSNNATGVGTGLITASAVGAQLNFGGQTAVFNVDGVKQNNQIIDPWVATLNVGTNVAIVNANGLTKNGDGILQLSGANTFSGGVNLTSGGLMIGGSSTLSARALPNTAPVVTSGPLGTGTLTIAGGTRILSSAAGNTIANAVSVNGNFEFDGITNVTLNGDVNLGGGTRTISVNTPQMTATIGGVISNGTGIVKDGYGTLFLNNANTFTGGVTLNNGTLVGQIPAGATVGSSFGTGAITYNGGILSLRTVQSDAQFLNDVNVAPSVSYVNFDVQGGNTVIMGNLNLPMSPNPSVSQVNVTGTSGSILAFRTNTSLATNGNAVPVARVAGQFQTFNIASGVTTILGGGGFNNNNEPLNIGAGSLFYGGTNFFTVGTTISTNGQGAAPNVNTSNAIYGAGQTVTISGTTTYTILPQAGTVAPLVGSSTGGLQQSATNVSSGNLNAAVTWGNGPTSVYNGVQPNDAASDRVQHTNGTLSTLVTYNGYLNVTGAGTYSFILGSDDYSALVIDGVEVTRDIGSGHGVVDTARGSIILTAGQHAITFKINTGTNTPGGGGRLLYSGPDTAASGTNNGYQAIDPSRLSYFTGPANAGNNFYNAAQIGNDYNLAIGANVTLQGLGSDYNSTIKSLTFLGAGTLGATNDLAATDAGGTGFIGVKGTTTISAAGAIVNPTTANLYLIGGIIDSGFGLTKTGVGTLSLNNSTAFTGAFAMNAGTTMIWEADALSTGGNTVASGASLDLNGVTSSAARNISINGVGTASQIGAIYNSSSVAGGVAGTVVLGSNSQIAGYGDITLSGVVSSAVGVTLTKAGADTLTLSASNTASLLGPVAITGGVLNNGALNSGVTGALGANTISVGAGTVLNLSGNSIAASQTITLNGTSLNNVGPNASSFGNLINTSISNSVALRNTVTTGNNMLQLANTANTATVAANVVLTAASGIGSNTFATGGDIIISGIVSGGQALTKVGGDSLTLRGANTYTGGTNVSYGSLRLDNAGTIQGTGGTITIQTGASFIIDNTGTVVQNRLNNATAAPVVGNNKPLVLNGGTFTVLGNASTAVTETPLIAATGNVTGININQGQNYINLTNNGANVTISTMGVGNGGAIFNANSGTVLITGKNLGSGIAAATNTNILYSATGTSSVIGAAGANASNNKGITPWAIVNTDNGGGIGSGTGTMVSFATLDSAAPTTIGLRALAASEYATALATNVNMNVTAPTSTATLQSGQNLSINSLTFASAASGLTLAQGTTLNLQSGGILATQSNTISGPGIMASDSNAAVRNFYIHTHGGGTTLTINASFGSTQANTGRNGEIVKAGAGTLVLGGANFDISNTRVQEGTLKLNNASAIYYRVTTPAANNATTSSNNGPTLQINGTGVLDLNGFDLAANNLNSINPAGNQGSLSGGTIINSVAGTKTLTINTTVDNTWAGNISSGTGVVNFAKYGRNTFTIANSNTYTGTTIIGGGATTMVDLGALRSTNGVTINQATLIWNDNGFQSDAYRLGATPAAVTFNGGGFQYNGRIGESSVANLGAVILNSGASQFTTAAATLGSATTRIASFTRNTGATINFAGSVQGDDGTVKVTGVAPTNYNGIIGGWATTSASNPYVAAGAGDFVSYDPATGFRAIVDYKTTAGISYGSGNANQPAFGEAAFGAGNNVRVNNNGATQLLNAGNNVVNSMVIGSAGTTTLSFVNATDTLFVQSGGILGTTDATTKNIGGATAPVLANLNGYLTAGNSNGSAGAGNTGYELFLHNLSTTLVVNSQIVDNGANSVSLVTSTGTQNGPVIRLNNTNTYTGTTTINSTDLRLNSATGPAIANSLNIIVNGGTENAADSGRQASGRLFFEQSNQLNSGATVTLNSGVAGLDLNGFNQTLANLVINNLGGMTTNSSGLGPGVRTLATNTLSGAVVGTLTLTGGISATNLANTSTIANISGRLAIGAGQHTILVDQVTAPGASAQIGLSINATILGAGGINKTGTGILALTGLNTYTGVTNVNAGTLVLGGFDNQGTPARITAQAPNSQFTVAAPATLDMRGGTGYIGSLNGAGSVTNSVYSVTSNGSSGNAGSLFIGQDNTSTGNFSGTFTNFINGANQATGFGLSVTKVGTGIQTFSGNNALAQTSGNGDINNVGTLDIAEGGILVNGANGTLGFSAINIRAGATLTIDNSVDNKANRLGGAALTTGVAPITKTGAQTTATTITLADVTGLTVGMPIFGPGLTQTTITAIAGNVITTAASTNTVGATVQTFYIGGTARTISMQGGTIAFKEGASLIDEGMALANGVGNVTLASGSSTWNFDTTGGNGGATINVNALTAGGGSLVLNVGAGQTLGTSAAGVNSINVYVNGGMNAQGTGPLSVIGTAVNAVAGVNGNVVGGVRSDVTAIDGSGTGFVTYDRYGFRMLATSEYSAFPTQPTNPLTTGSAATPNNPPPNWAAISPTITPTYTGNALVNTAQRFTTNTTVVSLRLDSGGSLTSAGGSIPVANSTTNYFNALGVLNTTTVSTGAIIANIGNLGFNGGAISAGGSALRITTATGATLNVDSYLTSTNTGTALIKEGSGILNLNKRVFLGSAIDAGNTVVNGGTLNLLAGANTLTVINGATTSVIDNLVVNFGGTVDLNGNDQTVANIASQDTLPGGGGIITNSGALANLYTNANSTFGGSINGAINLYKTGANNLTLSSSNAYTGTTNVQGGLLILQDSGTLASTTYNLNGGQLRFDERSSQLSDLTPRIPLNSTINFRSGTLSDLGGASSNVTQTFTGVVSILQGQNEIRQDAVTGVSSRNMVFTNFITPSAGSGATVHFNSGNGNLGETGTSPSIVLNGTPTTIGGIIPWAIAQTDQIAMYNATINPNTGVAYGVAVPNVTGGAFTTANYAVAFTTGVTGNNINQASTPTAVSEAITVTTRTFNSLRMSGNNATVLNLNAAGNELLRIEAGVVIASAGNLTFNNGRITVGAVNNTDATFYNWTIPRSDGTAITETINAQIVDNGTGKVSLSKNGTNTLTLNPQLSAGIQATGAATNTTIAGSTTVTLASAPTTVPTVGMTIIGPGIPNGATITAVAGSVLTISAPAFATTSATTIGYGASQVVTGTNAAVASGAVGAISITVTDGTLHFVGQTVSGTGIPGGVTIASIAGNVVTTSSFTASAAIAVNQAFGYTGSTNVSTNSAYTGNTIVNSGTLALNGAVGARVINAGTLTINNTGAVTMTNAGQIAPTTDVTINGGGSLTFAPVTVASPATGGINAINSLTFNNNGGSGTPTLAGGTNGIVTIKNGLITSNSDNQGSTATVSGVLNFGQVALGTTTTTTTVTVADIGGFVAGQTVTGLGITAGTTILSISGNVLTLSTAAAAAGVTGAISTVNQAAGSLSAMAPTLNVTTTNVNELSSDLQISAIIANSAVGGAGLGGWSNLANGGAALVKSGNGTLTLSGTNTFDNGFNLNAGTVTVANSAAFGTGKLSIAGGTSLQSDGTVRTITNAIDINGDVTFGGTTSGNGLTQTTGAINLGAVNRNITVTNPTVTANLGGVISGSGGLTKSGNGILILGGANNYTGGTTINSGLVQMGNASALGSNLNDLVVKSPATLNVNGLSLTIDGLTGEDATHGGLITNSGAAATLTVGNNNETTATFAGTLTNGANALNLTKVGTGTQVLSGVNTYKGTTNVSAGSLIINGSLANTVTTVSAGAKLGGTGTIGNTLGGSVTVAAAASPGGGAIDLSTDNAIGTLTINGVTGTTALTMGSATAGNTSVLTLNTSNNATDQVVVGNNANVNIIGGVAGTGLTVNLVGDGSVLANGVYNLISYGGAGTGVLATLGLNPVAVAKGTDTSNAGGTSTTSFNVVSTALQLIVGNAANYYWDGNSSGATNLWNTVGSTNWLNAPAGTDPGTIPGVLDTVIFNSNAANTANLATALGANFSINALQFGAGNNNANSASINTGNFTLTLNAGGITQASGSAANSITSSGSGGISLLATQAWANNSANNLTVSAPVSGAGGLLINGSGAGKVVLGSATANTYTGGTTIAGTAVTTTLQLAAGSSNALGAVTNALAVNLGTLDLNSSSVTVGSLSGTGTSVNSIITNTVAATTSTLTINQNINTAYSGAINNTGTGKVALVKNGTGNFVLSGTAGNTYTGGTTINNGTITVGAGTIVSKAATAFGVYDSANPDTNTVQVNAGGTVAFNSGTTNDAGTNFANSFNFNGGSANTSNAGGRTSLANGANAKVTIGALGATFIGGNGGGDDFNLAGVLTGSGTINVNNTGGSWLIISNANGGSTAGATYTGTVNVNGTGSVTLGNNTGLAGASVVTAAGASMQFLTTINAPIIGSLAGAGNFNLTTQATAGAVNLTVGGNNTSTIYTGIIAPGSVAGGKIIKTGTGTFAMNAANTFTGGVTVSNGTVTTNSTATGFGTAAGSLVLGDANSLAGNNNTAAYLTGSVTVTNPILVTAATTAGTGTATIGSQGANGTFSGAITMNKDLTFSSTAGNNVTLSGATINSSNAGTQTLTFVGPGDGTISSSITGNATNVIGLTVNNSNPNGTLRLTGASTYVGATTATSGVLLANNASGSATGSGAVSVGAAGTLGGTGTVVTSGMTIASLGTLRPGDPAAANGIGSLAVTGNVTLNAGGGSILDFQIKHTNGAGTASVGQNLTDPNTLDWTYILGASEIGGASDHLNISGLLTVNTLSTTSVNFSAADTGTFTAGMAWDLLDWGSIANNIPASYNYNFSSLNTELNLAGLGLDTSRFYSDGYIGVVSIVPEPSRMLLLMFGLMALFFRRRRRLEA
ncbi:hypothetical protein BH11VER1_BH11VER1_04950 [soil metagenome]